MLRQFSDVLAPAVISCDSPRFLAFIPAAPTKASLLFDMVVSCVVALGHLVARSRRARCTPRTRRCGSSRDLAGLPAGAGGVFVQGGSAANLSALVVARDTRARGAAAPRPRAADRGERADALVGREHDAHHRRRSAASSRPTTITSPAPRSPPRSPPTPTRRRSARSSRPRARPTPASSTTSPASRAVCGERDLWMHVDAAYGGAALLAPSVRDRFAGIEHADSLVIDPHKWLYAPFDCAALLYREPGARARGAHAGRVVPRRDPRRARRVEPVRLRVPTHPPRPRPAAVVLARGPRLRRVPRRDRAVLATAHATAARASARSPTSSSCASPSCRSCCSGARGWTGADYDAWSARLLDEQIAFVTPSRWHGEPVARLAFLHPETTLEIVDEILATTA